MWSPWGEGPWDLEQERRREKEGRDVVQDDPAGLWKTGFWEVGVSCSNGIKWAQSTRLERCCGFVKKSLWRGHQVVSAAAVPGGSVPRAKDGSKAWHCGKQREG